MRPGVRGSGFGVRDQEVLAPARNPMRDRLVVALDVPTLRDAERVVDELGPVVTWFKVGLELFTAVGPQAVAMVHERGRKVFLDLKFHDIPRTVTAAVRSAANLGVRMMNIHVTAGEMALRGAVHVVRDAGSEPRFPNPEPRPLLLGVTRLTSEQDGPEVLTGQSDRKSTRLNSSHQINSYAVFCLKKKIKGKADSSS